MEATLRVALITKSVAFRLAPESFYSSLRLVRPAPGRLLPPTRAGSLPEADASSERQPSLPLTRSAGPPAFADPPASLPSLRSGNALRSVRLLSGSASPESLAGAYVSGEAAPSLEPDCAPENGGAVSAGAVPLAFPVSLRWRFASPGRFRRDAYASRRNRRPSVTVSLQFFAPSGSFPAAVPPEPPLALRRRRGSASLEPSVAHQTGRQSRPLRRAWAGARRSFAIPLGA